LLFTAHRIPRFGAQPFGCSVRSARGTRLALLPPSFLSSSPATVRSARTGAVKEASAGLVRLAGAAEDTALRALTAHGRGLQSRTRWWSQGRRLDMATAIPLRWLHGKRSAQARIWKPGRRRQPSGARERWKPVRGETPQAARCATRTTARPAMFLGRGRPDFKARCTNSCARHREASAIALLAAVVWPSRRSRFGGLW